MKLLSFYHLRVGLYDKKVTIRIFHAYCRSQRYV